MLYWAFLAFMVVATTAVFVLFMVVCRMEQTVAQMYRRLRVLEQDHGLDGEWTQQERRGGNSG